MKRERLKQRFLIQMTLPNINDNKIACVSVNECECECVCECECECECV